MLKLRSYQEEIIKATRNKLIKNDHVMMYACQGSGKSILAAFMATSAVKRGNRTLLLTHRLEILKQNLSKIESLGQEVHVVRGVKGISNIPLAVAMSQTISARLKNPHSSEEYKRFISEFDFIIIDEAHRGEHDGIFPYFNKKARVVGMSGTVVRSGNMPQLADFYSDVAIGAKPMDVINLGFILPSENYAFTAPSVDNVAIDYSSGDYNQTQLRSVYNDKKRYAGVISNCKRIGNGMRTIVFTTGGEHTESLTQEFVDNGMKAKYLLSGSPRKSFDKLSGNRQEVIDEFRRGDIDILVSVEMLTTGFDAPEIERVVLDFSTLSYSKYQQCVARGDRPFGNQKAFLVLDFGDNIKRFGKFESEPIISLFHKKGGNGVPPKKECPPDKKDKNGLLGCQRLIPVSMMKCPFCGYEWMTKDEIYEVELERITEDSFVTGITTESYCAKKKLEGWSNQRILMSVCAANPENQKKEFMKAIKVLRGKNGEMINPQYWWMFKKTMLDRKRKKPR